MPYWYSIQEFYGIQQHKDGSLLPPGTAYDARNVDTSDGNLRLGKGYTKHFDAKVGGSDKILRLMLARYQGHTKFYVATEEGIYAQGADSWTKVYTFTTPAEGQVDYLQNRISGEDYLIVATGTQQMVKIKLSDDTAALFGTGNTSFEGKVSSYNSSNRRVTLNASMSDEAIRHALADGVVIDGTSHEVMEASGNIVRLRKAPPASAVPAANDDVVIRGGGSTAACNYLGLYSGRLFAAGDPAAPNRLYWSAVTGNGRTCEDWLSVDGSVDASGGYVEIGETSGDSIVGLCVLSSSMLIFKSHSVYRLFGDRPSTFTVERVEDNSETLSNSAVVVKYDTPQYLTRTGIKYYDGTGILPMNSGQRVLARFVDSIVSVEDSKGIHADNHLYFTCRTHADATYDDAIIDYDIARQCFMIRDGFEVADMCVDDANVYMINGERYLYKMFDGYTYDGDPINAYWNTQPTDLMAKGYKKQIKELLFRGMQGRIRFMVRDGATRTYGRKNLYTDNDGFVSVGVSTNLARVFEILIDNEEGSYFEITGGIDISYERELRAK